MLKAVAFAHALADITRWRIAQLIASDALCVCELADIFQLPQSTLSTHLQVMRRTGVASVERCDKWSYYRLAKEVAPVWKALNALAGAAAAGKPVRVVFCGSLYLAGHVLHANGTQLT